jgi:hypothetical protein
MVGKVHSFLSWKKNPIYSFMVGNCCSFMEGKIHAFLSWKEKYIHFFHGRKMLLVHGTETQFCFFVEGKFYSGKVHSFLSWKENSIHSFADGKFHSVPLYGRTITLCSFMEGKCCSYMEGKFPSFLRGRKIPFSSFIMEKDHSILFLHGRTIPFSSFMEGTF